MAQQRNTKSPTSSMGNETSDSCSQSSVHDPQHNNVRSQRPIVQHYYNSTIVYETATPATKYRPKRSNDEIESLTAPLYKRKRHGDDYGLTVRKASSKHPDIISTAIRSPHEAPGSHPPRVRTEVSHDAESVGDVRPYTQRSRTSSSEVYGAALSGIHVASEPTQILEQRSGTVEDVSSGESPGGKLPDVPRPSVEELPEEDLSSKSDMRCPIIARRSSHPGWPSVTNSVSRQTGVSPPGPEAVPVVKVFDAASAAPTTQTPVSSSHEGCTTVARETAEPGTLRQAQGSQDASANRRTATVVLTQTHTVPRWSRSQISLAISILQGRFMHIKNSLEDCLDLPADVRQRLSAFQSGLNEIHQRMLDKLVHPDPKERRNNTWTIETSLSKALACAARTLLQLSDVLGDLVDSTVATRKDFLGFQLQLMDLLAGVCGMRQPFNRINGARRATASANRAVSMNAAQPTRELATRRSDEAPSTATLLSKSAVGDDALRGARTAGVHKHLGPIGTTVIQHNRSRDDKKGELLHNSEVTYPDVEPDYERSDKVVDGTTSATVSEHQNARTFAPQLTDHPGPEDTRAEDSVALGLEALSAAARSTFGQNLLTSSQLSATNMESVEHRDWQAAIGTRSEHEARIETATSILTSLASAPQSVHSSISSDKPQGALGGVHEPAACVSGSEPCPEYPCLHMSSVYDTSLIPVPGLIAGLQNPESGSAARQRSAKGELANCTTKSSPTPFMRVTESAPRLPAGVLLCEPLLTIQDDMLRSETGTSARGISSSDRALNLSASTHNRASDLGTRTVRDRTESSLSHVYPRAEGSSPVVIDLTDAVFSPESSYIPSDSDSEVDDQMGYNEIERSPPTADKPANDMSFARMGYDVTSPGNFPNIEDLFHDIRHDADPVETDTNFLAVATSSKSNGITSDAIRNHVKSTVMSDGMSVVPNTQVESCYFDETGPKTKAVLSVIDWLQDCTFEERFAHRKKEMELFPQKLIREMRACIGKHANRGHSHTKEQRKHRDKVYEETVSVLSKAALATCWCPPLKSLSVSSWDSRRFQANLWRLNGSQLMEYFHVNRNKNNKTKTILIRAEGSTKPPVSKAVNFLLRYDKYSTNDQSLITNDQLGYADKSSYTSLRQSFLGDHSLELKPDMWPCEYQLDVNIMKDFDNMPQLPKFLKPGGNGIERLFLSQRGFVKTWKTLYDTHTWIECEAGIKLVVMVSPEMFKSRPIGLYEGCILLYLYPGDTVYFPTPALCDYIPFMEVTVEDSYTYSFTPDPFLEVMVE